MTDTSRFRTFKNFPQYPFRPGQTEVLYAEDINAIIEMMKPVAENSVGGLLGSVDLDLAMPAGQSVPLYIPPPGFLALGTFLVGIALTDSNVMPDINMTLSYQPSNTTTFDPVYLWGLTVKNTFTVIFGLPSFGYIIPAQQPGDSLIFKQDDAATPGVGKLRIYLFGTLLPIPN